MSRAAIPAQCPPTVLLFLKAPRLGEVKTRLAAAIGPETALRIYRSLADAQVERLPCDWPLEIHFTPADALPEMKQWLGESYTYRPQVSGGLGERLSAAVEQAFAAGSKQVVCIGADCPALDAACLHRAAQALTDESDIVFGPASDGGYYLIGMKRAEIAVFQDIPWSTENTLAASLKKADQLGLQAKLLDPLHDLDTVDDLQRARDEGHLPATISPL